MGHQYDRKEFFIGDGFRNCKCDLSVNCLMFCHNNGAFVIRKHVTSNPLTMCNYFTISIFIDQ